MSESALNCAPLLSQRAAARYEFALNDPYDRHASIKYVIPQSLPSKSFMKSIREYRPAPQSIALWYLGQNGFILKYETGPLIGIDLYLTNSCASIFADLPFRMDRQLPVFVEPEDLDIDVFVTTHSHQDHADPETIARMPRSTCIFVGPFDSCRVYRDCGIPPASIRLIHPGEVIDLGGQITVQASFALPTDNTDLNHTGMLFRSHDGLTFFNTGDTAYTELLAPLLPTDIDVCAICINGGFHNLSAFDAAKIVHAIRPRVVIPSHYDMMINNTGSPELLRVALDVLGSKSTFHSMNYYEPWLYRRD